ncbi:DNA polymerase IV [Treponema bryantii]|uniref:DNA polymerase IV n=1 Tax=Treponema bryantii TaxID=163 RepID=UPI002B2D4AAE|nr:hypothetical protein TRBR_12650 [Treponema bryantii]
MQNILHWYLHVDLDAFFASVEQLDNPELRGKPVIVGGKPEDRRSVVSTASYEARAFGVHSAMPTFQAYKLCPQGIFVHGRMHRYAELSHQIMNIFRDYSPDVDQMSIDEAFVDLTGTEKLFGPPEETARKIKARVKEETGLTVSIGLATTKYLAKIASGLSKPDGFYVIKPGTEEAFMLNLPLNKVWGLGPKSLELIRSKGLTSTRDIYERDYNSLEFLFGKNMAGFLYNVVRGGEKESFSREAKSHSISAETTFPFDLTDIYTIETELLELAHGVFFRLLKEESFSRTAFVKIRYDDFSTSTVQETVERNIITLDSFFEIIKRLFEKRYENGRGIRLLGVGFENITKEEKPYQQDLFDTNNDKKKQAVEKAILNLSKKHPEIKVSKARTLKAALLAFLLAAVPSKMQAEQPVYLFDYELNDNNHVDFSVSGLWKMEFTGGLDITFGNDTLTAFSPSVPVFTQETDISALLMLNNHWYFEAAFADEFTKNTFAFGYKGDGLIRHFRLANRGITMNEGYSAEHFGYSLRGGNNQAPGISLQLVSPSEKIKADFLLRYDMTETKSQIYYGMNKVSDVKIRAEDFAYGREFHFPSESSQKLFEIQNVYLEVKGGSYTDDRGIKYRKLRTDEYSIVQTSGSDSEPRLYISQEAESGKNANGEIPSILITFYFSQNASAIISDAGNWNNESSFLGQIQKTLGNGGEFKLEEYDYEMLTAIEGEPALIIQNYEGFSPFLCPSIYNRGTKDAADFLVIADKSEMPVAKFKAFEADELYTRLYENFFDTKQSSIRVANKETPQSVYPFAEDCPEIYLGFPQKTDLAIRARTYSPVTEIQISKKAAAGTVQVYKNGNLLTGTVFNENTGVVELNQAVSETDQLLITWQEENSDFTSGAVSVAAGLKIDFFPELTGDIALTTRIPVYKKNTFIENGTQKSSFTALTTGITYDKNGLILKEKAAISLLNDNTAEGLLLYSWEGIWEDYQDEKESSPDAKILEPQKTSSVSFTEQDFSAYQNINIEFEFKNENATGFTGPILFIIDQDTGTKDTGDTAVYLEIKNAYTLLQDKTSHTIKIQTDGKEVLFDGNKLSEDIYTLKLTKEIIPSRISIEAEGIPSVSGEQQFFITKVSFNDALNYGTARNYISAEYKKEGNLITIKDYELFKDVYISVESDQGSGNFTEPDPFISIKTKGSANLSGVKLSADAAVQNVLDSPKFSEAGHSIKTDNNLFIFKLFSVEDTYRYRPAVNELRKENSFSIDFTPLKIPVKTALKTSAVDSAYQGKQNAEITAAYNQKISDSEIGINAKLSVSQKNPGSTPLDALASYSKSWLNISALEYSLGKENAVLRNTLWSANISGIIPIQLKDSLITLKPKLIYELSDTYQLEMLESEENNNTVFADKEHLALHFPFTKDKNYINFEISRTGGGIQKIKNGGNYKTDNQLLFSLQDERYWFYTSIPFYELFDQNLKDKLSYGSSYAAKYEGNFRRNLYNSKKDLYIPSALTLALTREISIQQPVKDLYQIKLVLTNNSVNNFGRNSLNKTFNWFNQEELTTSISAIMKIPATDASNFKINIQAYAQLLLFISEKTVLNEQFNFSIEDTANWDVKDSLSYSRPSKTSLITTLAQYLVPQAKQTDYSISRKDSISAEIGKNEDILKQTYSINHTVGIDFLDYYNVYAGIDGKLILNQNLAHRFNLSLTLGAKVEF